MKQLFLFCFLTISIIEIQAQNGFTTNSDRLEEIYSRYTILYPDDFSFDHIRPFSRRDINRKFEERYFQDSLFKDATSIPFLDNELNDFPVFQNHTIQKKKTTNGIFYPNDGALAEVNRDFLHLKVNPVAELKVGKESHNEAIPYTAFRGLEINGSLNKVVNFYAQFTENQYRPFQYIQSYGQGFYGQNAYNFNPYFTYWKDINNNTGYDFTNALAYVEYSPSKYFSAILGHDRNHYGYGYRSLFIGDNGAPYFQLKLNAQFWKFHYQAMYAQFTGQYIRGGDRLLPKKYGAFHLLTFKPSKKVDIGLFEGIMFHRNDGFELNYLNPIMFYHSIEHTLGSSDNVLIGIQGKYQADRHTQLYAQFLLDDIQVNQLVKGSGWWGNKYGIQLGTKFVDIANIPQLDAQIELNLVSPFTYSHYTNDGTDTIDNYTHYNQPLAHPFGANFVEIFSRISYYPLPKLRIELKYDYNVRGLDMNGLLYGNNIFSNSAPPLVANEYNNTILQGNRLSQHILTLGSQFQFFHNMYFDIDGIFRHTQNELTEQSISNFGFLAGVRINLRKRDYIF